MAGPWENYAQTEDDGPWNKFGASSKKHINSNENDLSGFVDPAASVGTGIAKAVIGAPGVFGDIQQLAKKAPWAPKKSILPDLPTSEDLVSSASNYIPALSETPQTTAGEYGKTIGEFLPFAGKNIVKNAIAPAIVSETAGQATKGTAAEPYARVVGALGTNLARGFRPEVIKTPGQASELVQAASRQGIELPQAIASDNILKQRIGKGLSNITYVGDPIVKASEKAIDQLQSARDLAANDYGQGNGFTVANRIGANLSSLSGSEVNANRLAAEQARDAQLAQIDAAQNAQLAQIEAAKNAMRSNATGAIGSTNPYDMGQSVINKVRSAEQAAINAKKDAYAKADSSGAFIDQNAVREAHSTAASALDNGSWRINNTDHPATSKMLDELANLSQINIPSKAVGARMASIPGMEYKPAAVSLSGLESVRKTLGNISMSAKNDADRTAASIVRRQFDNWVDNSVENHLYSGDPNALEDIKAARAANKNWRQNFGYNPKEDADRTLNKIVNGEVTPQETANWIIGSNKIGSQGSSARLIDRLVTATNNDPEVLKSIRGGVWNRLTQAPEGVTPKSATAISDDINDFLNGSGRAVSSKLFDEKQQKIAELYAKTLTTAEDAKKAAGSSADAAKKAAYANYAPNVGPIEELAKTVLGSNGKTDEALYSTITSYAQSNSRGDLITLAKLLRITPQNEKGDLAGAFIRQLGNAPGSATGFSGDVFTTNWRKISPQAKDMIFGQTGKERQNIEDLVKVSSKFKELNKFSNPSGTAQNLSVGAIGAGLMSNPVSAIGGLFGGRYMANQLAKPASANPISKRLGLLSTVTPEERASGLINALYGATR